MLVNAALIERLIDKIKRLERRVADLQSQEARGPFSGATVSASAAQSCVNADWTLLEFDEEEYDTDGYHSNTVNPSRLTVPADGYYAIQANVGWASNNTGERYLRILWNGSAIARVEQVAASRSMMMIAREILLSAGDYVELQAWQTSGGALNTIRNSTTPIFSISRTG